MLKHSLFLISLLLFSTQINANSFGIFTFTGTVATEPGFSAQQDTFKQVFNEAGLYLGAEVTFQFLVDTTADGQYQNYGGETLIKPDTYEIYGEPSGFIEIETDYFYSEYLSGSALGNDTLGAFHSSTDTSNYLYGYSLYENNNFRTSQLMAGSRNDPLSISSGFNGGKEIKDWVVGDTLRFTQGLYIDNFYASVLGDVELVSIEVIPVPAAVWLFASGLFCFIATSKRKIQS